MIILDSSFIIALVLKEDVHHNRAKTLQESIAKGTYGEVIISDYVFDEIIAVLLRKKGFDEAIRIGNWLLDSLTMYKVDDVLFEVSWQLFQEKIQNCSLTDCSIFAMNDRIGCKYVATFDKGMKNANKMKVVS